MAIPSNSKSDTWRNHAVKANLKAFLPFAVLPACAGRMVAPGTWIFSDEPQIRLAGERVLIVT